MPRKSSGSRKPTQDPKVKAERRMSLYESEYWEILQAAQQGKDFTKVISDHARCNAFLSRYYKFRMDAVAVGQQGALAMRDFHVTAFNDKGERFNSRYTDMEGPFTVTWKYEGLPPEASALSRTENIDQRETKPFSPVMEQGKDAMEELVKSYVGVGAASKTNLCPPHEADPLEVACVHCGKPWDEVKDDVAK